LLLPQPRKKTIATSAGARLGSPQEVGRSIERDQALTAQARREREQIAAERDRFELTRDKALFALEALATVALLVSLAVLALANPSLLPALLLGGGGAGGIGLLLGRRSASS